MKKLEPIFLNNDRILPWKTPKVKGVVSMLDHYDGITKPVSFAGYDCMSIGLGQYLVVASAGRYSADIARLADRKFLDDGKLTNPIVRELLFKGGVEIYKTGNIAGTDFRGLDLVAFGKIWDAIPLEGRSPGSMLLNELIFGKSRVKSEQIGRVEKIIEGYRLQERENRKAQDRRASESYSRGWDNSERFD